MNFLNLLQSAAFCNFFYFKAFSEDVIFGKLFFSLSLLSLFSQWDDFSYFISSKDYYFDKGFFLIILNY